MQLKVYVIDLEIPPRVKKWGIRIGIPFAVLLGGGAVAYAAGLVTWTDGQSLKAADLNANFTYVLGKIPNVQTATLSPTGAVSAQSGSWISSVNHAATGSYGVTFSAGTFAVAPTCVVTANAGNMVPPTFQVYDVGTAGITLSAPVDSGALVICVGD